jgi:hypothetical protein
MKNEYLIKTTMNLLLFAGNGILVNSSKKSLFPNRNIFFLATSVITKLLKGKTIKNKKFLTQILMFLIPIISNYLGEDLREYFLPSRTAAYNPILFDILNKLLLITKILFTTFYLADKNLEKNDKNKNQFSSIMIALSYLFTYNEDKIQNILFTLSFFIWNSNYVHEIKEFENSWFYQYHTLFKFSIMKVNSIIIDLLESKSNSIHKPKRYYYIFSDNWLKEMTFYLNNFIFIYQILYVSILPMILEGYEKGKNIEYDGIWDKGDDENVIKQQEKHLGEKLFGIKKPTDKTRKILRNITLAVTSTTAIYSLYSYFKNDLF